jgi:hypothetical protein
MSGKRGISNFNASQKKAKLSLGKKTNEQETPPVEEETPPATEEPDATLSAFLLLPGEPAGGSAPSSSAVTLPSTAVHGAQPAPETAADTINAGITSAEDGRRYYPRLANATGQSGRGNETQGSSSVTDVPEDEDENEDENASDDENEDENASNQAL